MAVMRRHFPLLLRRCSLLPRESLPSLVLRLAQLNYYEPVTLLQRLYLAGSAQDRLDWPSQAETYEQLFELAWLDPYQLHDATGHYFAGTLTPPGTPVEYLQLPRGESLPILSEQMAHEQLRPESAVQFCPACLKEAAYHRVSWLPVAVAACITHKRLLVDRCPGCQGTVSIRAIVEDCRCPRCGADLQAAPSARVKHDEFGLLAQRFMRGWLKVGRIPVTSRCEMLLQQHPRLLFCLIDGLVDSIKSLGSNWSYLYQPAIRSPLAPFGRLRGRLTPEQSYRLYATAFKALLDWPHGFHQFLQAYTSCDDGKSKRDVVEDLGRLGARWFNGQWEHPTFSFVHDALAHYLVDAYVTISSSTGQGGGATPSNSTSVSTFVSPIRAARLLDVSVRTIKRLVDAKFLVGYRVEHGEPRRYGAVRQDELLLLHLAWRKPISLEEAARWLGLTKSIIVDLIRVGLLTAEHKSDPAGNGSWLFNKQNLDKCYSQLTRGVRNGSGYSGLAEAARTLSFVGLNVADILKLVVQGKLRGWAPSEAPALAKLSFEYSQIDALLEKPEQGKGLLNSELAANRLGVAESTFFRWVITGLFSPVVKYAYETYFNPDEIDCFRADWISSQEAARLLGAERAELEEWYREWGFETAVKGIGTDGRPLCLFRREEVQYLSIDTR